MGLLLAHGGWDRLEGLLWTMLFIQKKCGPGMKSWEALSERDPISL